MFIHFGANSQLQDYSLVKIHEKEKETTLGFKVVSRSGGIWLESWDLHAYQYLKKFPTYTVIRNFRVCVLSSINS